MHLFELRLGRRSSKMREVFLKKVQLLLVVNVKLRRHGSARDMSSEAEVVVFARNAGGKLLLGEDLDAAVAGAGWLLLICDGLLLIGKGTWDLLLLGLLDLGLDLGCDALGGAVDDAAVLDEALDHPVAASGAVDAVVYAGRAEIVITTVAYTAVEVLVLHGLVAVVAVYHPRSAGVARLRAECETGVVVRSCEVVEEACTLH